MGSSFCQYWARLVLIIRNPEGVSTNRGQCSTSSTLLKADPISSRRFGDGAMPVLMVTPTG